MAKGTYKAKASKFIKYGGKFINEGEEFEVKISDVEEMKKHAEIEIPKEDKKVTLPPTPPVDPPADDTK